MNYIHRAKLRLKKLLSSKTVPDIFHNISPNTFDFIAALPLFLYIVHPALVLIFAFPMQLRLFIVFEYPDFLKSILPGILLLYGIVIVLLLGKNHQAHVSSWKEFFHQPVYVLFLFAMIWMLISICVNGWTDISLLGDGTRHEGLLTYWGYIGVLFFLGSLIRNDRIKRFLCNTSLVVSIAVAVFAVYQFYILPEDPTLHDAYPTSIFFQFNHYGYYLAVHIMLAAAFFTTAETKIKRLIYLLLMSVNVIVLNVNNTFGAWLACVFGFIFMMIVEAVKNRRVNLTAIAAFAMFFGISMIMTAAGCGILGSLTQFFTDVRDIADDPSKADEAGTTRWLLWKTTAGYISKRPLFGYGIEGIDDMLEKATGSSRTHNEYLQYAATFGLPEAIAYTAACIGVFVRNVKHKKELKIGSYICLTAAFTYLVSACFGITMYNTAPFLFIFLGLSYRSGNHQWFY